MARMGFVVLIDLLEALHRFHWAGFGRGGIALGISPKPATTVLGDDVVTGGSSSGLVVVTVVIVFKFKSRNRQGVYR